MKSVPFIWNVSVPVEVSEGQILDFGKEGKSRITKIKSIRFLSMNQYQVIGLCRSVIEENN